LFFIWQIWQGFQLQSSIAKFNRIGLDKQMTYLCAMYKRKLPVNLYCGLDIFMEVLNGKWKLPLIWCINEGTKRPGELHRRMPKASRRMLDTQLKQLTTLGIISKTVYDQLPLKVEYVITDLGKSLIPVIEVTARWGEEKRDILEPILKDMM
jgi:DNA-binding HxlR family transcriptional regulator